MRLVGAHYFDPMQETWGWALFGKTTVPCVHGCKCTLRLTPEWADNLRHCSHSKCNANDHTLKEWKNISIRINTTLMTFRPSLLMHSGVSSSVKFSHDIWSQSSVTECRPTILDPICWYCVVYWTRCPLLYNGIICRGCYDCGRLWKFNPTDSLHSHHGQSPVLTIQFHL